MSTDTVKERDDEEMNFDELEPQAPPMNASALWYLPPILQEIGRKGARFNISNDGKCHVEGFYKNGPMVLTPSQTGELIATDKRNRSTAIKSFDDLVKLNFDWWKISTSKQNYVVPQRPWLDAFIEKKWVVRQVIFVPKDGKEGEGSEDESMEN